MWYLLPRGHLAGSRSYLPGQESRGQGAVRRHCGPLPSRQGQEVVLDVRPRQAVWELQHLEPGPAVPVARGQRLLDLLRRMVGRPDRPRSAGRHLVGKGADGLVDGRVVVVPVQLVYVDAVGLEVVEAAGQGARDVLRAAAGAYLGAERDLVPAAARRHPAPDDLLRREHLQGGLALVVGAVEPLARLEGLAAAVQVARVEECHAPLDGVVHHPPGGLLVHLPAPVAAAQPNCAHSDSGRSYG